MTLTPNQKKYRKKRDKCRNDDRRAVSPAGFTMYLINPSNICARVSEAAYRRLIELSEHWGLSKAETLNRVLIKGIPKYSRIGDLGRHAWDSGLLNNESGVKIKQKGASGTKQLNYLVSSTAFNKLRCHRTATGRSMARIVQDLLLRYKPLSPAELERSRTYQARMQERYEQERKARNEFWVNISDEERKRRVDEFEEAKQVFIDRCESDLNRFLDNLVEAARDSNGRRTDVTIKDEQSA